MASIDSSRTLNPSAGFGGFFARVLGVVSAWNERRATRNALSQLSDRELDDIGLARGDINEIARQI
ncbi:hypothetical protein ROG8370_02651 [Roseovarius gaetbuli]|uniref:YjiS-like domain-containing protein n=1 Tax=Roseovarius gaetbuli TaxID=1356575 RepID=A0A1X6ZPT1_9RHOB|nr:DUF1127 domain-containing protein [Roseovarius gaetbuli]SLN58099.1 hypothetical protein ROG8370_02651 [Roseovarius gaetbuli]